MDLNLTMPGLGGGGKSQAPPPPPDPLPRPPTRVDANAEIAARGARRRGTGQGNIRNTGGGQGLMTSAGDLNMALKGLTGS